MDLLPACLLTAGATMTGAGIHRLVTTGRWKRAEGEITGASPSGSFLDPHKHSSFRFTTEDGTTHEVTSRDGATVTPVPGKKVRIVYDPDMPMDARVDSIMGRGIWMLILGEVLLAAGILLLVL